MSFWGSVLGLGVAAVAYNKLNPPMVTVPSGYQMVSLKPTSPYSLNDFRVKFKKNGSNVTEQFKINRGSRSRSGGWEFHW